MSANLTNGSYAMIWSENNSNLYAKIFSRYNDVERPEFFVSNYYANDNFPKRPFSISGLKSGGFVLAWRSSI